MIPFSFTIKTLGCKFNQYESDELVKKLVARGWTFLPFGESAELVIINTCTVTDRSDKKCRNYIRQGARFAAGGRVVVMGCMAESQSAELLRMPEVALVIDNKARDEHVDRIELVFGIPEAGNLSFNNYAELKLKTRVNLKVQEGCDGSCSYCIVPSVRGKPVSRPWEEVVAEAKSLIANGAPELVLTGITIGKYADGDMDIAGLLEKLVELDGAFRVRVTSIEPGHVNDRLIEMLSHPKVCRHIHLPLQSGSDKILKLMNRPYNSGEFLSVTEKLKKAVPGIAIGSDIIVGFPGESEDDFKASCHVAEVAEFSYLHHFTFSARKGTPAATMPDKIEPAIMEARSTCLHNLGLGLRRKYIESFINSVIESVITYSGKKKTYEALTSNYVKADLADNVSNINYLGKLAKVRLTGMSGENVLAQLEE